MTVKTYYYSERGLVNKLIEWLNNAESNSLIDFFKLLDLDLNENSSIEIFDEFSFGDFGSPDLIIKVDNNVYIIEAKITSFVKASTKLSDKLKFKDNASKINIQLLLRKRFINQIKLGFEEVIKEEYRKEDENIYKNGRALKKSELINEFVKEKLKDSFTYYYVALTSKDIVDKNKIYDDYFKDTKFGFKNEEFKMITWQQIDDVIGSGFLEETWKFTNSNYNKKVK